MLILSDQITLFMVFLMLCFAGLLVMFYFVLRAIDDLSKNIRVERSALVASLRDMETSVQRLEERALALSRVVPEQGESRPAEEEKKKKPERPFSPEGAFPENGFSDPLADYDLLSIPGKREQKMDVPVTRLPETDPLFLK